MVQFLSDPGWSLESQSLSLFSKLLILNLKVDLVRSQVRLKDHNIQSSDNQIHNLLCFLKREIENRRQAEGVR